MMCTTRIFHTWDKWREVDWGDAREEFCEECDGTGGALIPCELVELQDLEAIP